MYEASITPVGAWQWQIWENKEGAPCHLSYNSSRNFGKIIQVKTIKVS